jgi:hypothetical protein
MVRKMLLSSFAGVVLTAILMITPSALAACQGYCADKLLINGCEYPYYGCYIWYDQYGNAQNAYCYYSTPPCAQEGDPPPDGDPREPFDRMP